MVAKVKTRAVFNSNLITKTGYIKRLYNNFSWEADGKELKKLLHFLSQLKTNTRNASHLNLYLFCTHTNHKKLYVSFSPIMASDPTQTLHLLDIVALLIDSAYRIAGFDHIIRPRTKITDSFFDKFNNFRKYETKTATYDVLATPDMYRQVTKDVALFDIVTASRWLLKVLTNQEDSIQEIEKDQQTIKLKRSQQQHEEYLEQIETAIVKTTSIDDIANNTLDENQVASVGMMYVSNMHRLGAQIYLQMRPDIPPGILDDPGIRIILNHEINQAVEEYFLIPFNIERFTTTSGRLELIQRIAQELDGSNELHICIEQLRQVEAQHIGVKVAN